MATVKIYRRESLLLVSVDEPFDEFDENQIYAKTAIHRLNMDSEKYSNQYIVETSKGIFYSILFDDHLYRIVNAKETSLHIYNLSTYGFYMQYNSGKIKIIKFQGQKHSE
jgi:hypothetical protein